MPAPCSLISRAPTPVRGIDGTPSRRLHGDDGATMAEFALAMPLLVSLLLGTVTAGLAYNQKISLTHATREAARYGATVPAGQLFSNGQSWAANVANIALTRAAGDLGGPGATLCVSLVEGSGPAGVFVVTAPYARSWYTTNLDGSPCDPTETYPVTGYDTGRRVQVRASRPGSIQTVFMTFPMVLTANASVKSESNS